MLWAWMMSFAIPFPFLALRAEAVYRRLVSLSGYPIRAGRLPFVSVIVPARNEEANLEVLLPSLFAQHYPGDREILVIDDGSEDRTAEVAAAHGAKTIRAGELPEGWYGKPRACHTGAQAAAGEWLLFTDADTQHLENGLARAMSYALDQNLDGLSLFLKEKMFGLSDRLALMAGFAGLFAGSLPDRPIMNGQFILIRKDVYHQVGGFEAVRQEAIEDFALAHNLRQDGYRAPILLGYSAAEVRMYRDFDHLWQGLARLGSGALKWSGPGSGLTAFFITGAVIPLVAVPLFVFAGMPAEWLWISWLIVTGAFLPWARRSGNALYALLAPFGALIIQFAAIFGLINTIFGRGISWKGRKV